VKDHISDMARFDLVIYGASGYTGECVINFVVRAEKEHGISWAVAGRNENRLREALDRSGKSCGEDLKNKTILVCDSTDQDSLLAMASRARVVLNCVGPYRFWGEPVVDACVEAGAHHLDISGEPQFLEKMQLKYHQPALDNGVYIIGACGFDSIPSDVGQVCVRKAMEGDVNTVETYLKVDVPDIPGPTVNFATYQCVIYGFAHAKELKTLRRQLYSERLPPTKPKLASRGSLHYNDIVDSWCLPFPGSDRSVMMRTQRGFYHDKGARPTQIHCYVQMSSLFSCIVFIMVGAIFALLASFKMGRSFLEKYPGLVTLGAVSRDGPPKLKAERTNFEVTLVGEGWTTKVESNANHDEPVNRRVTTTVRGKNIGYGATCECLVQAALVLLQETDRLPSAGGVYPPGFAFAETTLAQRLTEHGVTFTTVIQDLPVANKSLKSKL